MTPTPAKREYARPTDEGAMAIVSALESEDGVRALGNIYGMSIHGEITPRFLAAAVIARFRKLGFLSDLAFTAIRAEEAEQK